MTTFKATSVCETLTTTNMANRALILDDLEFLDKVSMKIQNVGLKTSKLGQIALQY